MKVLLYVGGRKLVAKSGVGHAIAHQEKAMQENGVEYTTNPKEDYDLVCINTLLPDSFLMALRAKRRGRAVCWYGHSTEEDFRNSFVGSNRLAPLFKRWLCLCYNQADVIVTPTPYSRRLLDSYGLKPPVVALSNGIDTGFFQKKVGRREAFREKYGILKDEKVILSVGLPIERKGILDFIALAKEMPDYQFYWFGDTVNSLIPAKIREAMEEPIPNLHFPGYVDSKELKDAYDGSDLFLFLSSEETEGIVILEAMAMEIPVLVRDIPVYEGWLVDKENVYKGRTVEEFKETAEKIISRRLPLLTEAARKTAYERDIKKVGQKSKEILLLSSAHEKGYCIN